jgi:hypothetical protein
LSESPGGGPARLYDLTDVSFTAYTSSAGKTTASMPSTTGLGSLLFWGQSHADNSGTGAAYTPTSPANCLQIDPYTGTIYRLADPFLGPTGSNGGLIGQVAQNLVTAAKYTNVLAASVAVGGSLIGQWTPQGQSTTGLATGCAGAWLNHRLIVGVRRFFQYGVQPHIVCMIGEQDGANSTSQANWEARFAQVKASLDGIGHTGKWLVVQETFVFGGTTNAAVRAAQAAVVDNVRVFGGVDLDTLDAATYRTGDGVHFDATGRSAAATLISNRIATVF